MAKHKQETVGHRGGDMTLALSILADLAGLRKSLVALLDMAASEGPESEEVDHADL